MKKLNRNAGWSSLHIKAPFGYFTDRNLLFSGEAAVVAVLGREVKTGSIDKVI